MDDAPSPLLRPSTLRSHHRRRRIAAAAAAADGHHQHRRCRSIVRLTSARFDGVARCSCYHRRVSLAIRSPSVQLLASSRHHCYRLKLKRQWLRQRRKDCSGRATICTRPARPHCLSTFFHALYVNKKNVKLQILWKNPHQCSIYLKTYF